MKVEAARARHEGVLLSKFQRDAGWVKGELILSEERDDELHRVCRVARLRGEFGGAEPLPPLFDATVIGMHSGWITITGFERTMCAALNKMASYQQSWFIVPMQTRTASTTD